jgi:hypothetical protein
VRRKFVEERKVVKIFSVRARVKERKRRKFFSPFVCFILCRKNYFYNLENVEKWRKLF